MAITGTSEAKAKKKKTPHRQKYWKQSLVRGNTGELKKIHKEAR